MDTENFRWCLVLNFKISKRKSTSNAEVFGFNKCVFYLFFTLKGWCSTYCTRWKSDKFGKIPSIYRSNPWCRKGPVQVIFQK